MTTLYTGCGTNTQRQPQSCRLRACTHMGGGLSRGHGVPGRGGGPAGNWVQLAPATQQIRWAGAQGLLTWLSVTVPKLANMVCR